MSRYLLSLLVLSVTASSVPAAKVKVWNHNQPSHYEKVKLNQVVISNEGVLRLSRQLKPLAGLDATHVWELLEDKDGSLYVATGEEGKVYKLGADGKSSIAWQGEESQV